jgi:hypothetical protein
MITPPAVALGARAPAGARHRDGRPDVRRHGDEEDDTHDPEELPAAEQRRAEHPERFGVGVEVLRSLKDLEVADHVQDEITEQENARSRHHELLADQGGGSHADG